MPHSVSLLEVRQVSKRFPGVLEGESFLWVL